MEKELIPELQPLFCSRASLLQAQDKMAAHPNMDCQLRLRFSDGTDVPLKIKRANIEDIITELIWNTERGIESILAASATTTEETEETTTEETEQTNE